LRPQAFAIHMGCDLLEGPLLLPCVYVVVALYVPPVTSRAMLATSNLSPYSKAALLIDPMVLRLLMVQHRTHTLLCGSTTLTLSRHMVLSSFYLS